MQAVKCVIRLFIKERIEIDKSDSMHLADAVIQRSAPHVIKSYGGCAGGDHPRSRGRGVIGVDSTDNYFHAFWGGHGGHTLQVVGRVTRTALNKIVPASHDHNSFGRRNG